MSNMNNIGFNNKAWGPAVSNLGSGMVPPFQSPQQQQVFQNTMGLQQQNLVGLQQMANNMSSTLNSQLASNHLFQQVSYPNTRVNTQAFQTNLSTNVQNNPGSGTKQKVFTGKVTQLHENFGLVDDEVIFQLNACVKGQVPMVGDRVLVEASYMPNMHFKWSATRIQVLSTNNHPRSSKSYGNSNSYSNPASDRSGRKAINRRDRSRERDRGDDEVERKRRREERVKDREERNKSPLRRRSRSPKVGRRRSRIVPRYMVQVPRIALDISEGDVLEVRRRYPSLYVPSDFFLTHIRWVDSFPPNKPFALNKPCSFHIMNKEVEPLVENDTLVEPPDADYLFSAKVMLMSVPSIEELYQKCCGLAEEKDKRDGDSEDREGDYVHPTRLINFLVGLRGKNETMAIGGPWSPSLDGENPDKDPSVLIKTAIRNCKALTGIDLSSCTQWYRFVEMYYRRAESTHKGKLIPARVETVVLFLPDVWSCLPTRLEWDSLQIAYKKQLDRILKVENPEMVVDDDSAASSSAGVADEKEEESNDKIDPTHHSKLDPKNMNVNELRTELKARNISSKGLKSQLVARLQKALKSEADKTEDNVEEDKKEDEVVEVDLSEGNVQESKKSEPEEKEKILDEKEKALLEKRYTLPSHQHILVHPSKTAKSGKFDCTVMSLSLLLDYRQEDSKEHSFEVSLFAELFNEMLIRDFGFNIYKSLYELPDKPKEDKKDEKKDKDEKKEKDDKDKNNDKKKEEKKKVDETEEKKPDEKHLEEEPENPKVDEEKQDKSKEEERKDKKETKDNDRERKESHKEDKQHEESDDDDDEDKDRKRDRKGNKKDKKEKVKLYTKDKHLLLSFVYFDQTHCGYIFEKDIEDLLYTLGLKLSRAQIRKLVGKVVVRDSLHYRKLTDKPKEEEAPNENSEIVFDWQDLSNGNKKYLPIFQRNDIKENSTKQTSTTLQEGFVLFQGSVVDINKLMSQLERSEKARVETETRMVTLKTDNQKLQEKYDKSNSTIKRLNSEVKDYREKFRSTEDSLGRISAYSKLYETTLIDIRDKIDPVLKSTSHKEEVKKEKERDDKDRKYDDSKSRWEKEDKLKKEPGDVEMTDSK